MIDQIEQALDDAFEAKARQGGPKRDSALDVVGCQEGFEHTLKQLGVTMFCADPKGRRQGLAGRFDRSKGSSSVRRCASAITAGRAPEIPAMASTSRRVLSAAASVSPGSPQP